MLFAVEKIDKQLQDIQLAVHREVYPITQWRFWEGDDPRACQPDFDDSAWAPFTLGDAWGGYDIVAWFRTTLRIPEHLRDKKLVLRFRVGPRDSGNSNAEAMLFVNGRPLQAVDAFHHEAWLPPEEIHDGEVQLALRAWSGVLDVPPHRHFRVAELIWIDEPTERFYYLSHSLVEALGQIDQNDLRHIELLRLVDRAFRQIVFAQHDPDLLYDSIAEAETWLHQQVQHMPGQNELAPKVIGIGHSHIDLAWLWRLQHAREKAGRTFSTVLHHMRQYPDYCFLQASPQLYRFVEQDYPDLYVQIKERVAEGRWEVAGGMWVEPDCNIPNGESLVRQILLGKRFFRREFGVDTHVLWLPDVFGYPWTLPQLMRQSGLRYFMTTKLSWSQFNRIPYDTFMWRGLDGSEVLTHFVTTPEPGSPHETYNGQIRAHDVKGVWTNYRQKHLNNELLMIYGWGDGGGGPTKEMLESAGALRSIPGIPRVELGKAEPFFERLEQRIQGEDVPVWDDELYLEFHRGTYTSQAFNKRANRTTEVLYHDAEWLSALADILRDRRDYPAERLHEGWELLLLNQFHDILPGSSIRQVYEDSRAHYAEIERIGRAVVDQATRAIIEHIGGDRGSLIVFNSLSWTRNGLIEQPYTAELAGKAVLQPGGNAIPIQTIERDGEQRLLMRVEAVPSLGYRRYTLVDDSEQAGNTLIVQHDRLENRFFRIELNASGQITALYDKLHRRHVLAPNTIGNALQVFQDKPMAFDAWDIDIFYRDKMYPIDQLVEATVEERGPLRGVLRLRWRFRSSTVTQRLTIAAHSPRIDFRTEVDWHEQQMLLKVAFPVAVRSSKATYDIQWGTIERPTHWNTSWDWARFETIAHKWVDLSEGNYGVALLNDCKYGHDVRDNVLRLTLIKSPVRPDPTADQGYHQFTYSLLPHAGDWRASEVVPEGYDLNYALRGTTIADHIAPNVVGGFALAEVNAENVIIETIKRAEDEHAWIVRVYENKQNRSEDVTLRFGRAIERAVVCNLLEEPQQTVEIDDRSLRFALAPYEIKTFMVWLTREHSTE